MSVLSRSLVLGALAAALSFGCGSQEAASRSRAAGSLALSTDDAYLYAVDTDSATLNVIDTKTQAKVSQVQVGAGAARVLVGPDDTIYVSNTNDGTVSVIRRGDWKEAARLQVGLEPYGLSLTNDGKSLLVVSATTRDTADFGTLTAIDTKTLAPVWELPVGAEPRGVAVVGDRALVSLYKAGEVVEVDLKTPQVLQAKIGVYEEANKTALANGGGSSSGSVTFRARALADVVATPDGARAFVPLVWAREAAIGRRPSLSGGYYSGGGPCNIGAVATAGLLAVDTGSGGATPAVDDLGSCFGSGSGNSSKKDFPASTLAASTTGRPIQGPTVAAIDATGSFVFVVSKETSNVSVMPVYRREGADVDFRSTGTTIRSVVQVGAGPDGIALTRDGLSAYVYSQFDHRVELLQAQGKGDAAQVVNMQKPIQVASDTLTPDLAAGRRLFFDAIDERMSSSSTNVSCGTCHLAGRDDGHVWSFPDGPRQTPALAGRKIFATAPYHWSGEFPSLGAFMDHTVRERMGGRGVGDKIAGQIASYIDSLPTPANPYRKPELTEQQQRGAAVFASAGCNSCHIGEALTNNTNADVGTLVHSGANPDNGVVMTKGINVPSLLGLARSAPYLHDGSAYSLEDRIGRDDGDRHGRTSGLSEGQRADLLAYLKTL